ncbi:MAG: alkaline phosphatase family protein [bacterium]
MRKLVLIGIDALDASLVKIWKADLPNMRRLMEEGFFSPLSSTSPPDSIPAWVTIYTGLRPWEHGILDSVDYLDIRGGAKPIDIEIFKGRTFWDLASKAGKRVCVINPLLAYPVWDVNGIMANGPVFVTGEVQVYPESIMKKYQLPEMGGMTDFPGRRNLQQFIERTEKVTLDLADFGIKLFQLEKWDLYFICFLTLDRVMHFLWRYYDKNDPTYPGENPFQDSIKNFFRLFDSIIGQYLNRLDDNQVLMVISDHGHGIRPPKALFTNEVLRKAGLLNPSRSPMLGTTSVILTERLKNLFLNMMQRLNLEDQVYKIASIIPRKHRKKLKTSSYAIDHSRSLCWTSEIGGGTSFGGIVINRIRVAQRDQYENLRQKVVDLIANIKDNEGKQVVEWIRRREEVFEGEAAERYPDIVFELSSGYGIDRSLYCGIIGSSTTHKKVSGGHAKNGVLMLSEKPYFKIDPQPQISDVFNVILRILDIE